MPRQTPPCNSAPFPCALCKRERMAEPPSVEAELETKVAARTRALRVRYNCAVCIVERAMQSEG